MIIPCYVCFFCELRIADKLATVPKEVYWSFFCVLRKNLFKIVVRGLFSLFQIFLSDAQTRKKQAKKRGLPFVYKKREQMSILSSFLTKYQ
ncbi:hypothetical protein CCS41_00715 [Candidatus Fukatsuia symbiotica]|uniref:Uncharacterized protein n=1 Tax=Candidatus Fukatsuia symbiotica TaxID=1878942 RepID=A0A2U8I2J8_9GAMM|nr:hypothetical protein CCS41_00715 [Candidatus Fukatsuia symbiotica]